MKEVFAREQITENLYTPKCIRTFTGIYMNVFEPTPEMICIEDIAHSLSMQCRFGGHLQQFFSVATHCYNVSLIVDEEHSIAALLHDASEAYLLDIPRPIKNHLDNYAIIEFNLMSLIADKFGFEFPLHEAVKKADNQMLEIEWYSLMLKREKFMYPKSISELDFIKAFEKYTK